MKTMMIDGRLMVDACNMTGFTKLWRRGLRGSAEVRCLLPRRLMPMLTRKRGEEDAAHTLAGACFLRAPRSAA